MQARGGMEAEGVPKLGAGAEGRSEEWHRGMAGEGVRRVVCVQPMEYVGWGKAGDEWEGRTRADAAAELSFHCGVM
jgi:hypothetical protein